MGRLLIAAQLSLLFLFAPLTGKAALRRARIYKTSKAGLNLRDAGDCFNACGESLACQGVYTQTSALGCFAAATLETTEHKYNIISAKKILRKKSETGVHIQALVKQSKIWDFESISGGRPVELHGGTIQFDNKRGTHFLSCPGDGSAASLGDFRGTCISDPTLCDNGVSFSFWARLYQHPPPSTPKPIFSLGGHTRGSLGFVVYTKLDKIVIDVRIPGIIYTIQASLADFTKWFHVTFTWTIDKTINLFLNGNPILLETTNRAETQTVDTITHFIIGAFAQTTSSKFSIKMDVDDFMVFERELEENEAMSLHGEL